MAASSAASYARPSSAALRGLFGFAFGLQASGFGAGGFLGGLLALPLLLALPARLGDLPQLGLLFLVFLVAGSRLLLEPLKQGLLRFRGTGRDGPACSVPLGPLHIPIRSISGHGCDKRGLRTSASQC